METGHSPVLKLKKISIFIVLIIIPLSMMKRMIFLFGMLFIPIALSAQVRITEKKVEEVLTKLENTEVDILEVKTQRKWKALELSNDMRSKMDYNIVLVKYLAKGSERTVIIDRNLVPVRYDYLEMID